MYRSLRLRAPTQPLSQRHHNSTLLTQLRSRGVELNEMFIPDVTVDLEAITPGGGGDSAKGVGTGVGLTIAGLVMCLLACAGVAYWKRQPLSEHLLWRLAAFRFNSLLEDHSSGAASGMEAAAAGGISMTSMADNGGGRDGGRDGLCTPPQGGHP